MSMCDRCYAPGQCCKTMGLSIAGGDPLTVWTDEPIAPQMAAQGLPFETFMPLELFTDAETGRPYGTFLWRCTKLQPDGRCGIYEARPALCRSFEAGSDQLCVHWRGAEAGADPE